jgi:hypothetical protein
MADCGCSDPAREARRSSTVCRYASGGQCDPLYRGWGHPNGGVCGCDAGKRIKGRKRHIITDTLGLMLLEWVHSADIQDCDAGSWSGQSDGLEDAADRQGTGKGSAKDGETSIESLIAWTCIASIRVMHSTRLMLFWLFLLAFSEWTSAIFPAPFEGQSRAMI